MHQARFLSIFVITFLGGVGFASFVVIRPWMSVLGFLIPLVLLTTFHTRRSIVIATLAIAGVFFGVWRLSTYVPPKTFVPPEQITMVRETFVHSLQRLLPEPHAGFLSGILVGGSTTVSRELKMAFQRTGTSHIVAVSGYNVTIIASLLSYIFLLLVSRKQSFWIVVGMLVIFMLITGAQASVVRASIMGITMLFARHVGRLSSPLHILLLAAGVMVAIDPTIVRSNIGFQLSFLATFGILVFEPILQEVVPKSRYAPINAIRDIALVTTAAQVCVLPLLLYYFESLALLALPVNVLVLPLIPLAMLFASIAGTTGLVVFTIGKLFASIAGSMSWIILQIITTFANLSWATVEVRFPWYFVVLAYVIIGVYIWHRYHRTYAPSFKN